MERYKSDQRRDFMHLHVGDDWETWLTLANAIADPDASHEEVHAAQQRAVALIRAISPCWTENVSELVADAWLTLCMAP